MILFSLIWVHTIKKVLIEFYKNPNKSLKLNLTSIPQLSPQLKINNNKMRLKGHKFRQIMIGKLRLMILSKDLHLEGMNTQQKIWL